MSIIKSCLRLVIVLQVASGCTDSKNKAKEAAVSTEQETLVEKSIVDALPIGKEIILIEKDQYADVEELTLNHFGTGRVVLGSGSSRITWVEKDDKTIEVQYLDKDNLEVCKPTYFNDNSGGILCSTPQTAEYKVDGEIVYRNVKSFYKGEADGDQSLLNATLDELNEKSEVSSSMEIINFTSNDSHKFFPVDFNLYLPLHPGAVSKTKLLVNQTGQISKTNNFTSHVSRLAEELIKFSEGQSFTWSTEDTGLKLDFEKVAVNIRVVSHNNSFMQTITKISDKNTGLSIVYRSSAALQKNINWTTDIVSLFKNILSISPVGTSYEADHLIDLSLSENGRGVYQFEINEQEVYTRPVSWTSTESLLSLTTYRSFSGVEVADSSCVRQGTCSVFRTYEYEVLDKMDEDQYLVVRKSGANPDFHDDRAQTRFHIKDGNFGYHLMILKK